MRKPNLEYCRIAARFSQISVFFNIALLELQNIYFHLASARSGTHYSFNIHHHPSFPFAHKTQPNHGHQSVDVSLQIQLMVWVCVGVSGLDFGFPKNDWKCYLGVPRATNHRAPNHQPTDPFSDSWDDGIFTYMKIPEKCRFSYYQSHGWAMGCIYWHEILAHFYKDYFIFIRIPTI